MLFKKRSHEKRRLKTRSIICIVYWVNNLSVFQNRLTVFKLIKSALVIFQSIKSAFAVFRFQKRLFFFKNDVHLWHRRMKHSDSASLRNLKKHFLKMKLIDSTTHECKSCAKKKMKKQISRRFSEIVIIEKF